MTDQNVCEFAHKGCGWIATLKWNRLSVRNDNYEEDPCRGQNHAISAWFLACQILGLKKADGELSHSGGFVAGEVTTESNDSSTCETCGTYENVTLESDPYLSELYGVEEKHWYCPDCFSARAADI